MIDKAIGKDCCGCKMCADICPKGAITYPIDNEGFWYPKVDSQKCVECSLCVKRCPILKETVNETAFSPDVYCAWIEDEDIRLKSTSGGMYYALAETMLNQGGYISGCVFTEDWKSAKHIVGNTKEDLEKIFRSKYFQSDTAGIYGKIKELLERGEKVLFSGSPCQNAALREYLGQGYENLVQCDFVCRGINSPKAHQAHVRELEKRYGSEVSFFNFKNKSAGWTSLGLLVKFKNGQEDFTDRHTSPWTEGYIVSNLYMRPSCEHCRFKKIPRVSDISFADFWGLDGGPENMRKGMSLVMVNTEKGRRFYEQTLPIIHSEPQTLEKAISGNKCILNSPQYDHKKREQFFAKVDTEDFSKLVHRLDRGRKIKGYIKKPLSLAKRTLKKLLKRKVNET